MGVVRFVAWRSWLAAVALAALAVGGCRPPTMIAEGVAELASKPLRTMPAPGWRRHGEPMRFRVADGRDVEVHFEVGGLPPNRTAGAADGIRYTAAFSGEDEGAQLDCDFRHSWGGNGWRTKNYVWSMVCTVAGESPGTFEQGPCAARDTAICEGRLRTEHAHYRFGSGASYNDDVLWRGTWRHSDGTLAQAAQIQGRVPLGLWTVQADALGPDSDTLLLHAVIVQAMLTGPDSA